MTVCTPITTCTKNVVCLIGNVQQRMIIRVSDTFHQSSLCSYTIGKLPRLHYTTMSPPKAASCSPKNGCQAFQNRCFGSGTTKNNTSCHSLMLKRVISPRFHRRTRINVSSGCDDMSLRLLLPKQTEASKVKFRIGPFSWQKRGLSAGIFVGLLVFLSAAQPCYAEASWRNKKKEGYCIASADECSHKKKILTDYSVTGIPGDGRCLFRSVAHGACIRSGKPAPNEQLQRELADDLRTRVADEFIKRREETEWFIEGDFESYVSQMRKPHVWGGEPELLMASHVLQMPITVYMRDNDSGGLISIAEYGQEYGKDNPILVLYHGYGHYDALQHIPGKGAARPRL